MKKKSLSPIRAAIYPITPAYTPLQDHTLKTGNNHLYQKTGLFKDLPI